MTNRSFPNNWTLATIGEASSYIQRGKSPKYSEDSQLAVINQKCIRWNQLQTEHQKYIHPKQIPAWDANRHIRQGDILWNSTGTGTVGRAYLVKSADCHPPKVVDSHVTIVRPNLEVDSRIIFYWIKGPDVQNRIEELCDGSTNQVELSRAAISEIQIPLPPINEQRRIADKLDRVLARVDAANEHLARVAPLIKRFRKSVLSAAFRGKLTEEFRKKAVLTPADETIKRSPEIPRPNRYNSRTDAVIPGDFALSVNQSSMAAPDGWKWFPMVEVARMESGHTPSRSFPEYWNGDVPWIGIADARSHHTSTIEDTIQHTNNLGLENSAARLLPTGTVCVSRTASVGYVVKMGKPMATSQDFVNWICGPAVNPDWLKWLFVAEEAALYRFGKGSTHTTIYFPEWLSLNVALPPLEEQSEIVRRVEKLFAFADHLEERLSQAQTALQKLTPALLAKAFRGELVPQDPNDEPASELLKRLQENRTDSANPSRARKPHTRKSP